MLSTLCRFATHESTFRVGSPATAQGGQVLTAVAFHYHPNWTLHTMDWDVGLIKVDPPVQFGDGVQPIHVVDQQARLQDTDSLTVTGWGLTQVQRHIDKNE